MSFVSPFFFVNVNEVCTQGYIILKNIVYKCTVCVIVDNGMPKYIHGNVLYIICKSIYRWIFIGINQESVRIKESTI